MQLAVLVGLATAASEPCAEAFAEFAAYETILRSDDYYPIATNEVSASVPTVFANADDWEPAYASARSRIDALAALAAERSGCEIERLGCFQRFLGAHTAMVALRKGGGNTTLTSSSFVNFRSKTLRWTMANLLWLVDTCEKEVAKQKKEGKSSALGRVEYP